MSDIWLNEIKHNDLLMNGENTYRVLYVFESGTPNYVHCKNLQTDLFSILIIGDQAKDTFLYTKDCKVRQVYAGPRKND